MPAAARAAPSPHQGRGGRQKPGVGGSAWLNPVPPSEHPALSWEDDITASSCGEGPPAHTISPRDWAGDGPSGGLQPWPATGPLASPWPRTSTLWPLGCGGYLLPRRCLSRAPRSFSEALQAWRSSQTPTPQYSLGAPGPQRPCSEGCGVRRQNTGFSQVAPHT